MICRNCQTDQPEENFYRRKKGEEARHPWCKRCVEGSRQNRKLLGIKAHDPFRRWQRVMEQLALCAVNQEAGLLPMGRKSRMQNPWPREI